METSAKFLRHEPCPSCGSKNNLARYDDMHAYCFGCNYYEHSENKTPTIQIPYGDKQSLVIGPGFLYFTFSDFAAMAFEIRLNLGEDFRHLCGCWQGVPVDLKIGPLSDKLECAEEIHVKYPTQLKQLEIIESPETNYPHDTSRHVVFVNPV